MPDHIDRDGQEGQPSNPTVEIFIAQLKEEERMLILLQNELYEGSWEAMTTDLRNRLEGRPYIFKLANRIRDDISRIESLCAFEKEHKIKLSDFVKPPSQNSDRKSDK